MSLLNGLEDKLKGAKSVVVVGYNITQVDSLVDEIKTRYGFSQSKTNSNILSRANLAFVIKRKDKNFAYIRLYNDDITKNDFILNFSGYDYGNGRTIEDSQIDIILD